MARYDFTCGLEQCAETFEVRLSMDERDSARILCPACGSKARRQVVPSKPPTCVMTRPLNNGGSVKERILP